MLNNLTKEMIYYSVIPVLVFAVIGLVILILSSKKKTDIDKYRYNYVIKVFLIVIISFVLPLIVGYTVWLTERYIAKGILFSNLGYVIVLSLLILALIILLIIICRKLYENLNIKIDKQKEFQN